MQFCELALPIAFVAILVAIKNAVKDTEGFQAETINATFPEIAYTPLTFRDYVTAMQAEHTCIGDGSDFYITGVPDQGYNWQVPFVKCDSRRCEQHGEDAQEYCQFGIIGVSPSDANDVGGQSRVDDFTAWLFDEYRELSSSIDYDVVKNFADPQQMNEYVTSGDYGKTGNPKIIMGIVFEGNNDGNYKYTLRQNRTNFNSPESEWNPATITTPDTNRLFKHYAKDDQDVCIPMDGAAEQGPKHLQESCTGQYVYNGVLAFQRLVHDFILHDSTAEENGYFVAESGVAYSKFPTFEYEESGFFSDVGGKLPFTFVVVVLLL